jgi:purine-binding chemotaxis protein CheW
MEERFLLFRLAGEGFALPLQEVGEVMEPPRSFPIPRVPRHFTGLINFHGTLTALVDLALYLGRQSRREPDKVVVVAPKLAHLAFSVDGVSAVVPREAVTEELPTEEPLTAAILQTEQGSFRLLRLEALISALEQDL